MLCRVSMARTKDFFRNKYQNIFLTCTFLVDLVGWQQTNKFFKSSLTVLFSEPSPLESSHCSAWTNSAFCWNYLSPVDNGQTAFCWSYISPVGNVVLALGHDDQRLIFSSFLIRYRAYIYMCMINKTHKLDIQWIIV